MDAQQFDAAITGIGLITPAGIDREDNWSTILEASGTAARQEILPHHGSPLTLARVPDFDAREIIGSSKVWRLARFIQLAIVATREAIADSGIDFTSIEGTRVGLVFGNSLGGAETFESANAAMLEKGHKHVSPLLIPMWMPNMLVGSLAIEFGIRGPSHVVATACASGTTAIGQGRQLLRDRQCDVVVVGASESALSATTLAGLANMGATVKETGSPGQSSRPFDDGRNGFVPAEGAAALVLEREGDARARGAHIYGRVSGFGSSTDGHHVTAPQPDGRGLQSAIRQALICDAGLSISDVCHVNAHGTSTPLNDLAEGRALFHLFGADVPVTSIKGVTGHPLAAAGAIEAAVAAMSVSRGLIPPTANTSVIDKDIRIDVVTGAPRSLRPGAVLSISAGFGGHNAALLITP